MIWSLLCSLISTLKTRRSLGLENLALRQQLAVRQRSVKRPRLSNVDRGFVVSRCCCEDSGPTGPGSFGFMEGTGAVEPNDSFFTCDLERVPILVVRRAPVDLRIAIGLVRRAVLIHHVDINSESGHEDPGHSHSSGPDASERPSVGDQIPNRSNGRRIARDDRHAEPLFQRRYGIHGLPVRA